MKSSNLRPTKKDRQPPDSQPPELLALAANGASSGKLENSGVSASGSETRDGGLLAGSTSAVQDGMASLPVMRDGEEPPDMLLALLNNALMSLVDSQQAKILGRVLTKRGVGTWIIVYGVEPDTANRLKMAQNA